MGTPGRPMDNRTREQIIRKNEQGVKARDIAYALDISRGTVNKTIRNHLDKNSTGNSSRD